MKSASFVTAFVVTVGLATPCLPNEGQGRGNARGQAKQEKKEEKQLAKSEKQLVKSEKKADKRSASFDHAGHARAIRDYRTRGSLPPGLEKREELPPGLRRQLRERGELPPGLRRHLVDVPDSLESRFPAVPGYYERFFAGDDLVVVDTRTNRIAAIVRDVLR